jgi:HSP20 family protein
MPREPWREISWTFNLERKVDETFAELIHRPWHSQQQRLGWVPPVDVRETAAEYVVIVDLPGVSPGEVKVWVEGHCVVVCGKRETERWVQTGSLVYTELKQGEFLRRIPLATAVDSTRLDVSAVHGLLIIRLPKHREEAQHDPGQAR